MINVGGWKHGHYCAPWCLGSEVDVVVLKKNPYSWLVSMYNYWGPKKDQPVGPDLSNVSFDTFVRGRVIFEKKAGSPFLYLAANPVQHWNNMYFHWSSIRINQKKLAIIPYEILLNNSEKVIAAIANHFRITKKPEPFIDARQVVVPSNEEALISNREFSKEYYSKKQYMAYFSPELISFVNDQLDDEVMMTLGYEKEKVVQS
jgi:hypothetical protein